MDLPGTRFRWVALAFSVIFSAKAASTPPVVTAISRQNQNLVISAQIPGGYRHAILEVSDSVMAGSRTALVAGAMNGQWAIATFTVPLPQGTTFLRIGLGTNETLPAATYTGSPYVSMEYTPGGPTALTPPEKISHVLNRLAYGPTAPERAAIELQGIASYIQEQLGPQFPDDSSNTELIRAENELFTNYQPRQDSQWISRGETWRYFKGTQAPPSNWKDTGFDDADWLAGATGIGYGDDDDSTVLDDMRQTGAQPGYLAVFLRKTFTVRFPLELDSLILRVDYDDGFVAYLNGVEVARANLTGNPPAYDSTARTDREAGDATEYDLTDKQSLLVAGENVLAIQVHNINRGSSDLSLIPELVARKNLPIPPERRIRNLQSLQQLAHVRGIYSRRQLQAILAEFWENHFTTDYDKVVEYFSDLRNSDGQMAMSEAEAEAEAAQAEYLEYQFFYDHALGNFGDLLLYSATSPSQLIYLDNVLNLKDAPNENYAREILELFAFGVDNRYVQTDIEQLARCFTGWTIRKVALDRKKAFPESSRQPPTDPSVRFNDIPLIDLGPGWRYFKGRAEPAPGPGGTPTTAWTEPAFNDASWSPGATSIGFGDGDDATVLTDMRNQYLSVYLRREFTIEDPGSLENLILTVDYDDGYVAYLNGVEIGRSRTMRETGEPPACNRAATGGHEAGEDRLDLINVSRFTSLLKAAPGKNVLALQVHNISLDSSDLSIHPRLVRRELLPGSVENGDPNGAWTFRFNPDEHDTGPKFLFAGTPYEIQIPAGRQGLEGLRDALDVVDTFVNHPSVSEFICIKLINRFVSDEINLSNHADGSAPAELQELLENAISAWNSTTPAGNIRTVMEAILTPSGQTSHFWSRAAYRAKLKTPIEFINGTIRALAPEVAGTELPAINERIGMHLFNRDDPDGWSEIGLDWIDTGALLSRVQFAQELADDDISGLRWDAVAWANAHQLTTAEAVVDYFDRLLFEGTMATSNRDLLVRFATTDDAGTPLPFNPSRNDFERRLRELVGMILSMPQCHYQ